MLARKALAGTAGAAKEYVEDVFSAYLYTGDGSTQTITNNIDLSGKGGLVWIKERNNATTHALFDSANGISTVLSTNSTAGNTSTDGMNAFNNNGFAVKYPNTNDYGVNRSTQRYISWTFRKAKKFFDVVTYTGNGTAGRTVSHNLGSVPGCIIVKRRDDAENWQVYHRGMSPEEYLELNTTGAKGTNTNRWNDTAPTSTVFSLGTTSAVNANGATYVAYLFAHDAGGFGDAGSDSIIKCDTFTTDGSGNSPTVNLGWEPQWLLVKQSGASGSWYIIDTMREWNNAPSGSTSALTLYPNLNNAEAGAAYWNPTSTGFYLGSVGSANTAFIYIAIRRGPMKTPETGTSVFTPTAFSGNDTSGTRSAGLSGFDLLLTKRRDGAADFVWLDKLRGLAGNRWLSSASTSAEVASGGTLDTINTINGQYTQDGINITKTSNYSYIDSGGYNFVWYALKRAPKFFDQVCYTGTGSTQNITHNLGVAPELIITKIRNFGTYAWRVYHSALGNTKALYLNLTNSEATSTGFWNDTSPTSSVFTVGSDSGTNASGYNMVAYLFSSLTGVSKVGSYTGTGSPINIDCGFTNGARFVLIKQTDSADNWYVWDTARGIVTGNEKYLQLNKTDVESTAADDIDPYSAGFTVNSLVNSNGASYIYLAIA